MKLFIVLLIVIIIIESLFKKGLRKAGMKQQLPSISGFMKAGDSAPQAILKYYKWVLKVYIKGILVGLGLVASLTASSYCPYCGYELPADSPNHCPNCDRMIY